MVDFSGYRAGWEQYSFLNLCVLFTGISYLIRVLFSDLEIKTKTTDDIEAEEFAILEVSFIILGW
jgi:hypothetical protein